MEGEEVKSVDRQTALLVARRIGCTGAHQQGDGWMPCSSHDVLLEVSRAAEPGTKTARRKRKRKVSSVRGDGWENLRERRVSSIRTGGPGITSGSPSSEITASGSTGTAVAGGTMGGVVDGSMGVASLSGSAVLSGKALPDDRDMDGWIYEGTPKKRFIGIQAAAQAVGRLAGGKKPGPAQRAAGAAPEGKPMSASKRRARKPGSRLSIEVVDPALSPRRQRRAERASARRIDKTVTRISDRSFQAEPAMKPVKPPKRGRRGREPRNPFQEGGPEASQLRKATDASYPRAVKPPEFRPMTTLAEMKEGMPEGRIRSTAEMFGIDKHNRSLEGHNITPERQAVHERIAAALVYGDADNPRELPKPASPTFHVIGGGPASGKSFLAHAGFAELPDRSQAAHIDVDEGRLMLPEYWDLLRDQGGDGEAAQTVGGITHDESSHISRVAVDMAIKGGHDIVMDSTGDGGPENFMQRLSLARAAGMRVVAHYTTLSIPEALKRQKKRAEETGRGVNEAQVIDTHVDVSRAVLFALREGLFDEFTLTDNEDTDTPVVIAEYRAGVLTIHNVELWDAFVEKALMDDIRYPTDYFVDNPATHDSLERLRGQSTKAAKKPKIRGKAGERLKEQGEGKVVVLSPDRETVWYEVTASRATDDDYRKMLATEPPADMVPMAVGNEALYRIRSGKLTPHIPDIPKDSRIPAMTRSEIRVAAHLNRSLKDRGIADTEAHREYYKREREEALSMIKRGIQPDLVTHLTEMIPEPPEKAA